MLYLTLFAQIATGAGTLWFFQARQMDRKYGKLKIQSDQMQFLNPLFDVLLIWLFDRIIYVIFHKCVTQLRRIGLGLCVTAIACCLSSITEYFIMSNTANTISVFYQIPQYFLLSVGEILAILTFMEFSYIEAPDHMKTIVFSINYISISFAQMVILIITLILNNLPHGLAVHLIYTGIVAFSCVLFVIVSWRYRYRTKRDAEERDLH